MDEQAVLKLRLKPRRFGRHHLVLVRDFKKIFHRSCEERKGDRCLTAIHEAFERVCSFSPTDKLDPLVRTRIINPEYGLQNVVLQDTDVESLDNVRLPNIVHIEAKLIPSL